MSTRCQIGVYEDASDPIDKYVALLYRHSDGYPNGQAGVVTAIATFLKEFLAVRGYDAEYLAAQLLHSMISEHRADIEKMASDGYYKDRPDAAADVLRTYKFIGYGVCNGFHGDIEYFYRIDPSGVKVYEVAGDDSSGWRELTQRADPRAILSGKVPPKFA